jgi:2,4-dienoyl-CoA reductase-like NADH-dependent reductase (Old Yellow Enzyme family)
MHAHGDAPTGRTQCGRTAIGGLFGTPRALEEAEIEPITRYASTAGIAKRAGFSGRCTALSGYLNQGLVAARQSPHDRWGR